MCVCVCVCARARARTSMIRPTRRWLLLTDVSSGQKSLVRPILRLYAKPYKRESQTHHAAVVWYVRSRDSMTSCSAGLTQGQLRVTNNREPSQTTRIQLQNGATDQTLFLANVWPRNRAANSMGPYSAPESRFNTGIYRRMKSIYPTQREERLSAWGEGGGGGVG